MNDNMFIYRWELTKIAAAARSCALCVSFHFGRRVVAVDCCPWLWLELLWMGLLWLW